jgi:hypothetical protein
MLGGWRSVEVFLDMACPKSGISSCLHAEVSDAEGAHDADRLAFSPVSVNVACTKSGKIILKAPVPSLEVFLEIASTKSGRLSFVCAAFGRRRCT